MRGDAFVYVIVLNLCVGNDVGMFMMLGGARLALLLWLCGLMLHVLCMRVCVWSVVCANLCVRRLVCCRLYASV